MSLTELLKQTGAYICVDCGKCSSICPLSRQGELTTPRSFVNQLIRTDNIPDREFLWKCLTCLLCAQRCPSDVSFTELIRQLRQQESFALPKGQPLLAHGGVFHWLACLTAQAQKQDCSTSWIEQLLAEDTPGHLQTQHIRLPQSGEVLTKLSLFPGQLPQAALPTLKAKKIALFAGCLPVFDSVLGDFCQDPSGKSSKRTFSHLLASGIRLMSMLTKELYIFPRVLCCGHDAYWSGQYRLFARLAEENHQRLTEAQIDVLVFLCSECYLCFNSLHTRVLQQPPTRMVHLIELLEEAITKKLLAMEATSEGNTSLKVAYHDSCRLGRHLGIYEAPRNVLKAIPGLALVELPHARHRAICCGTSAWLNCDSCSRTIQLAVLNEVASVRASTLVCSCPKCLAHFRCAQKEAPPKDISSLSVQDIIPLVASALAGRGK